MNFKPNCKSSYLYSWKPCDSNMHKITYDFQKQVILYGIQKYCRAFIIPNWLLKFALSPLDENGLKHKKQEKRVKCLHQENSGGLECLLAFCNCLQSPVGCRGAVSVIKEGALQLPSPLQKSHTQITEKSLIVNKSKLEEHGYTWKLDSPPMRVHGHSLTMMIFQANPVSDLGIQHGLTCSLEGNSQVIPDIYGPKSGKSSCSITVLEIFTQTLYKLLLQITAAPWRNPTCWMTHPFCCIPRVH